MNIKKAIKYRCLLSIFVLSLMLCILTNASSENNQIKNKNNKNRSIENAYSILWMDNVQTNESRNSSISGTERKRQNSVVNKNSNKTNQILDTYWAQAYGDAGTDYGKSIQQTSDSGYIIAGYTDSFSLGGRGTWVIKLDPSGNLVWQKAYGNIHGNEAWSVQQTSEGGYIVAGSITNYITNTSSGTDLWVLKLDAAGNITWQKSYGDANIAYDAAHIIRQTSDLGYIVAGYTQSYGAGGNDIWVLKLNSSGNVTWQKAYGGSFDDEAWSIQQTSDLGYVVAGYASSFGAGERDMWVLKLDSSGNITWQRTYGALYKDEAYSAKQSSDGGYIVAGYSSNLVSCLTEASNIWVLKLDSSGNISWQKAYGNVGTPYDYGYSIQQTTDSNYILAASSQSCGGGNADAIAMKLDSSGNILWQKSYGGTNNDDVRSIQQITGGYILTGISYNYGLGIGDVWALKIDPNGNIYPSCSFIGNCNLPVATTTVSPGTPAPTVTTTTTIPANTSETMTSTTGTQTLVCKTSDSPGRVGNTLKLSKSGLLNLTWSAPSSPCLTQCYGIYQGTLPWTGYNHTSSSCSTCTTSTSLPLNPGSYYYLVVAQYNSFEGSYGLNSSSAERPPASSPCYPQLIGICN